MYIVRYSNAGLFPSVYLTTVFIPENITHFITCFYGLGTEFVWGEAGKAFERNWTRIIFLSDTKELQPLTRLS